MHIEKILEPLFGTHALTKFFIAVTFLAFPFTAKVRADFSTHNTTAANTFGFTSDVFYVEESTNAIITVDFIPGDRSYSGSVDYSITGGTAEPGEDYEPVNGTLVFSGPGTPVPVIKILVNQESLNEGAKTVEISLHSTTAILTRSNATLILAKKSVTPSLRLAPGEPGYLLLSWSSDHADFILEKSSNPSAQSWSLVSTPPNIRDGFCWVSDAQTETPAFYRLRKAE